MKHLELFAGIGGFRQALELLTKDGVMSFQNIGFSEIDKNAVSTYKSCYNPGPNELELGDIVAFTSDSNNILRLQNFDLLTGGFPCQAFSMMGHQKGFGEGRGQMFFRIVDILETLKDAQLLVVEGTLYPLLTRMKNEGLLSYRWQESTGGPPRKYYALTPDGQLLLQQLNEEWHSICHSIEQVTHIH